MPLVISFLGFCVVFLACYYIYSFMTAETMSPSERIDKFIQNAENNENPGNVAERLITPSTQSSLRMKIQSLGSSFNANDWSKQMENKLVQAGMNLRASEFALIWLAVIIFCMLFFFLISGYKFFMGLVGVGIGYIIPLLIVKRNISLRRKKFNNQIADALILISSSLRSGYSFMQAIEMVANEMHPPISEEFYRVLREINLGVTTDEAMNHMAERISSVDLDLVVTAVLIQRQIGGNLTEILDNIANTIRERVKISGHIKTLTAQGRMSGIIISLLPLILAFLISFINPGYMDPLFNNFIGYIMLGGAFLSELVGIMLICKIVDIKI